MKRLYDEMERQIAEERARLRSEEVRKEIQLRQEMEGTLELKDRQLQQAMDKMKNLQVIELSKHVNQSPLALEFSPH